MKKSNLRNCMKVKLRNGEFYTCIIYTYISDNEHINVAFIGREFDESDFYIISIYLSDFSEELIHKNDRQLDITEVYVCTASMDVYKNYVCEGDILHWRRTVPISLSNSVKLDKKIKTTLSPDILADKYKSINPQFHEFKDPGTVLFLLSTLCSRGQLELASELLNCEWLVEDI